MPLDGAAPVQNHQSLRPETQTELTPEQLPVGSRITAVKRSIASNIWCAPRRMERRFWVECAARPLYGKAGNISGAVLIFRDITARKKREFALESTDQLRDFIYQGNLAGIVHTTVDGRILDCNDALVRMLGYSSVDELRGIRAPQLYYDPLAARRPAAPRERLA